MTTPPSPRSTSFGSNVDIMRIMSALETDNLSRYAHINHENWIGTWPRSRTFTKRETISSSILHAKCSEVLNQEAYDIVSCLNAKYKMWNNSGGVEKTPFVIVCMMASKTRCQLEEIYKTLIDDPDDVIFRASLAAWMGMGDYIAVTPELAAYWRKRQFGQA